MTRTASPAESSSTASTAAKVVFLGTVVMCGTYLLNSRASRITLNSNSRDIEMNDSPAEKPAADGVSAKGNDTELSTNVNDIDSSPASPGEKAVKAGGDDTAKTSAGNISRRGWESKMERRETLSTNEESSDGSKSEVSSDLEYSKVGEEHLVAAPEYIQVMSDTHESPIPSVNKHRCMKKFSKVAESDESVVSDSGSSIGNMSLATSVFGGSSLRNMLKKIPRKASIRLTPRA